MWFSRGLSNKTINLIKMVEPISAAVVVLLAARAAKVYNEPEDEFPEDRKQV